MGQGNRSHVVHIGDVRHLPGAQEVARVQVIRDARLVKQINRAGGLPVLLVRRLVEDATPLALHHHLHVVVLIVAIRAIAQTSDMLIVVEQLLLNLLLLKHLLLTGVPLLLLLLVLVQDTVAA